MHSRKFFRGVEHFLSLEGYENNMPIIGDFSGDLASTDLVFGVGDGIKSMYALYHKRNVNVDKNNQARYFATTPREARYF
jgi:hypothetical protein